MRIAAEISDEHGARLEAHVARVRAQHGRFTRADAVRSAMRFYLDAVNPPAAEPIDSTAIEIVDGLALPARCD